MDNLTEQPNSDCRNAESFPGLLRSDASTLRRSDALTLPLFHSPTFPLSHFLPLLLLIACLTSARAAVRFDVFLGYDGILPQASWFPVAFEIQNDGPAFNGVIEITPGQFDQSQTRLMTVELPTQTMKRFVIPVYSASRYSYNSAWNARLLDERGKLRAPEAQGLRQRRQHHFLCPLAGALPRTAAGMPVLVEAKSRQGDSKPEVARLLPNLFPDNPIALQGLDVIYLNAEKALELKVPQVTALLAWLHSGGHLIVGVEQVMHVNGNEWLRQLLPCELTGMGSVQSHPEIQEWLRSNRQSDGREHAPRTPMLRRGAGTSAYDPYPFATPDDSKFEQAPLELASVGSRRDGRVLMGSESNPLALVARRGRGQITALLFSTEMEPFLSWKNRPYFWAKMIDMPPEVIASDQPYNQPYGQSIDGAFGAMIDSKQVRKLPVGWLLVLLVAYLVVIGPLDQYWLKKINKQMLTWLTFPAYVACFSVLIYLIGYKLRAGETEWNELHMVDVMPIGEQADMRGRTYASVYSPVNAKYKLASEQPFAALRGEAAGYGAGGQDASKATVMQKDNSFQAEIAVPVWTSQLYVSDWWRRGELPVSLSVRAQGGAWQIEVDNRLDQKLANTKLIVQGEVLELGELPSKQVTKLTRAAGGHSLHSFVQTHAGHFQQAITQRQQAFGGNTPQIHDIPNSTMAASFISQLRDPQVSQQPYNNLNFIAPQGMDLSPLIDKGDAVLLAWLPDYSPVKSLNRFAARRNRHDTLLRVATEVKESK